MEIPPADIIDRLTIVKLKLERIGDQTFKEEISVLEEALNEFRREGIEIKQDWIDELYKVNGDEWNLLEEMFKEKKTNNFEKIGKIYLETELVNKRRSEIKNEIVKETGKGFKEIKKNHPSA